MVLKKRAAAELTPRQLGVAVPDGAQCAVHAARRFLSLSSGEAVLLKLDFSNAFNAVDRQRVLDAVADRLPELSAWAGCSYGAPSLLFFGGRTLESQQGVQQGDPLGPLLFSLAIHDLVSSLRSPFCVWYLDDCALAGSLDGSSRTFRLSGRWGPAWASC